MHRFTGLFLGVMCLAALTASAQTDTEPAVESGPVSVGGGQGLPAPASDDTVRTNLWLVEALMADIAAEAALALPEPPASVRLEATREDPSNDLFRVIAGGVLDDEGFEVYLPTPADSLGTGSDFRMGFDVISVDLQFPEVGRTLGMWRRWVSRSIQVTVNMEVTRNDSGRLLLADRITRTYTDRLEDKFFDDVNSEVYDFTAAQTSESGWKRRTEEIVVLGTLAALIAVYFANTSN